MGVSGQRHAQAALYPWERTPCTHCTGGWVGLRAGLDTEATGKISYLCRGSNLDRPVVQSVARHYTDFIFSNNLYNSDRMVSKINKTFVSVMIFSHLNMALAGPSARRFCVDADTIGQWYSTFFVRVPPDIISLQLCTPKVVGT
jgi:hypothetical protein